MSRRSQESMSLNSLEMSKKVTHPATQKSEHREKEII
jgi:hypothetical protein